MATTTTMTAWRGAGPNDLDRAVRERRRTHLERVRTTQRGSEEETKSLMMVLLGSLRDDRDEFLEISTCRSGKAERRGTADRLAPDQTMRPSTGSCGYGKISGITSHGGTNEGGTITG